MKRPINLILIIGITLCFFSCGKGPSDSNNTGNGSLEILIWANKPSPPVNDFQYRETSWSKLVIQVSASDMATVHDTLDVIAGQQFYSFTVNNISAGENRLVEAWTIDDENDTIHGVDSEIIDIEAAKTTQVLLELFPIKGSIYAVLTDIPTIVDSVELSFVTAHTTWQVKAKRQPKLNMCLDKIPFGTTGTISIVGYSIANDTVASWKKENFTFTNSNTVIEASFISVGKISIQVTIHMPGVTIIVGIMDTTDSIGNEMGGLIISEIMYSANDSEYVELYNPAVSTFDDTIILQKDNGTFRYFYVTIPPKEFLVIGRIDLPWGDTYHSTQSALDLSSTTGNWLTLRLASDSSIIDNVAFQTGSNEQEWPNFSSSANTSIVLDSLSDDPEYNNFGRNWIQAETYIDTTITKQIGTPGESGS
jgi:hypothetical protein